MKQIKSQILLLVTSCLMLCLPISATASEPGFNKIIYFGDSLSDNGNLYSRTVGIIPKSPPYFEGRFSNGPTWAELVAEHYQQSGNMTSENFAVGSSTAVFHNPAKGYLPYTLTMSVYNHLIRSAYSDRAHTLYAIWIGANDYLNGSTDAAIDSATTAVVDSIGANIENLISRDAKYFLVMNLPDISNSPYGQKNPNAANFAALTKANNQKLEVMIAALQKKYPEVKIRLYDIYSDFDGLINNPEYYNVKYNVNLTNLTESCWGGGYTRKRDNLLQRDKVLRDIEQQLQNSSRLRDANNLNPIDANKLADEIIHNPALAAAYEVGASYAEGEKPCTNPDNHLFWDKVHPTRIGHGIFSKIMIEYIDRSF
jgi:phospholipase/lecithinase/hemolysin